MLKSLVLGGGKSILVEISNEPVLLGAISDLPPGATPTSAQTRLRSASEQMKELIGGVVAEVESALRENPPSEFSVEFTIGFAGETQPVPFLAKASGTVGLKIIAKWKAD